MSYGEEQIGLSILAIAATAEINRLTRRNFEILTTQSALHRNSFCSHRTAGCAIAWFSHGSGC
jgi:hypothetical protein